jgi:hypothetical protein
MRFFFLFLVLKYYLLPIVLEFDTILLLWGEKKNPHPKKTHSHSLTK